MSASAQPTSSPVAADLARAARILALRTRRASSGVFSGGYTSAFRGGGLEFEESRPYVPGDDLRALDWNALARSGEPFVKHFRAERDQTLLLALDVSGSMGFSSCGRSQARAGAFAAALLAAAAGRAGDRVGLFTFDTEVRTRLPPARGRAHVWRAIRSALSRVERAGARTLLSCATSALRERGRGRAISVLISDFRDPAWESEREKAPFLADLHALSARHDVVSIAITDPRDDTLPSVGRLRLADPENPRRRLLLDTASRRVRASYAQAARRRRVELERALRAAGSDVLWLRTDRDPLHALLHFFRQRASRTRIDR